MFRINHYQSLVKNLPAVQDNTFCNFRLPGPNHCKVVNLPRFPRLASFEQVLRFLNKSRMCSCVRVRALYDHDRFPLDVSGVRDPAGFLDYSSIEELSWLADRLKSIFHIVFEFE